MPRRREKRLERDWVNPEEGRGPAGSAKAKGSKQKCWRPFFESQQLTSNFSRRVLEESELKNNSTLSAQRAAPEKRRNQSEAKQLDLRGFA